MSARIRKDVGELFVTGFKGRALDRDLERAFRTTHVGGVILFAENASSPEQLWNLCAQLRRRVSGHLLIGIDQEGGRVQRLKAPFTVLPPMANVGLTGSVDVARRVGRVLGTELGAAGINLDFAPVMDLRVHERSVIGDRAFSDDPEAVASLALALVDELEKSGVIGCAKHFPGHGATAHDSHLVTPECREPLAELRARHLVPFARAVAARVPMIMSAHVRYTAGDPERVASLSPFWIDQVLRGELGYDGVVITDELGMEGVAGEADIEDIVLALLKTSTDLFLIRDLATTERAVATVHRALDAGWVKPERVERSAERVRALKRRFADQALIAGTVDELKALIGDPDDQAFADALAFS